MSGARLFRPGGTQRRRFWLVDRDGIPTRRVRLTKIELLYLFEMGRLPSRGITGIKSPEPPPRGVRAWLAAPSPQGDRT